MNSSSDSPQTPNVTVVTITFNDELGLARTIKSVQGQDYAGTIQHIVIDGAESARVQELCADTSIELISQPDHGRYDAMNKGIRASVGAVIWFLHSGDTFGSTSALTVAFADAVSPRAEWGYGLARLTNSANEFLGVMGSPQFSMKRFALGGKPVPHQASFFGTDLIKEVGPYSTDHGLAADQLWIMKFASRVGPRVVPEFLCNFDVSGAGSTRAASLHYRDMIRARGEVNVKVTRYRAIDVAISTGLALGELTKRRIGSALWRKK